MRRRFLIGFTAILAIGCTAADALLPATPTSSLVVAEATRPAPTPSPLPTEEPLPSDLDPALGHAIDMRRGAGLRHDLAYVVAAQTDPRARVMLLDFPMYPEEEAKFLADQSEQQEIVSIVQSYATRFVDEFGGVYIDRDDRPGFVTALWTAHLPVHEAAIRESIGDRSRFAVREVNYSEAELRALQDVVAADWREDWVEEIPARFQGVGVHLTENVLLIEVSSANPNAVAIIEAHYDLGDRLRVTSDGSGAALLPGGTVRGKVAGPDGERLESYESLALQWHSDDPGDCGGGDIGYGVGDDGTFELPCKIGTRTILVMGPSSDGDSWIEYGRASVRVEEDQTTKVTIRLTAMP
jgi:hypothetical protein